MAWPAEHHALGEHSSDDAYGDEDDGDLPAAMHEAMAAADVAAAAAGVAGGAAAAMHGAGAGSGEDMDYSEEDAEADMMDANAHACLLYTSPSPRD